MMRIKTLQEIQALQEEHLRDYLLQKTQTLLLEYGVDSMDSIGCYVILHEDEFAQFPIAESEFVEIIMIEEEVYLHGVHVLSDDYAEDIYMAIGVIQW